MNWLISLLMASAMFSSESGLPTNTNYSRAESNIKNVAAKADETERFEQTYPLNANGRVSVSNINGSTTVETWDRNEVKLEYVKTADSRERFAEVDINVEARQDSFTVETNYEHSDGRNQKKYVKNSKLQVDYHLTVPRNAILDEIETVNGSINISNASNTTKASAVNGEVRATNLRGAASLSTVNGTVVAEFDDLKAVSKISLETVNGQVDLVIPSDADATVKADTLNGSIVNDFGLRVRKGEYVGKDLHGKIGNGAVQIRMNSVNGGLSIKRQNDGKNLSPATNLLSQKSKNEDDDFEFEIENEIKNAVREAQKEVAKIKPELDKLHAEAMKEADALMKSPEFQAKLKEAEKLALAQVSDGNWFGGSPTIESKNESFAVKGTPLVKIDAKDCAVTVRGWDKAEVKYEMTKIARGQNQKPLGIKVNHTDSEIDIKVSETDGDDYFGGKNRARLEVFVPKKTNLRITADGEIRLENVTGNIELQGEDEAINVRDSGGALRVASSDGLIRVIGFDGELQSNTIDGMMNLDGNFKKLSAETVDGTIVLTLANDANVNVESNTKDVKSDGVPLVYQSGGQGASVWKVGRGGETYRLYTTEDGQIFVRNAKVMNTVGQ